MKQEQKKSTGVIWISGYSAAGKTTIGRHVEQLLHSEGNPTVFLDGDQLRSIFANKWDYSLEERVELARIYFRLCSHLSKQGLIVIISAVAMFDDARRWYKMNVENGIEVYLRVPLEERMRRDVMTKKNIYKKEKLDYEYYSEPANPDIVIDNYGEMTCEEASRIVIREFWSSINKLSVDYGRTKYWSDFYRGKQAVSIPSPFAEYCLTNFKSGTHILEIGCGNGRDARFFAKNGYCVVAIDKSEVAIDVSKKSNEFESITYICCEASAVSDYIERRYDYIYSRFSLHAMTEKEEVNALHAVYELLELGGLLCIECRSINDSLSRRGEVLSPTERIDGHYRRFIELQTLLKRLKGIGYVILEANESRGMAKFKDEDPVVIRVIAKKSEQKPVNIQDKLQVVQ